MITKLAMMKMVLTSWFTDRMDDERGASLVEYALLLALVAVVAIGALVFLGNSVHNTLNNVGNNIANP